MPEQKYSPPIASLLTKQSVSSLAERIAAQIGYVAGSDLQPIVEGMGGKVTYQDFWELDNSASGSIRVEQEGEFEIFLGMHTSQDRDRFTICHEIGHYVLHYLYRLTEDTKLGPMQAARYGADRTEYEANWFAASFLMPSTQFKESYQAANGDIYVVAAQFKVSLTAALVRAKALGIGP
ncbi:MAG: ImmA/IrrE family metallo-endopeptidase [Gallionella sp.]